MKKKIKLAKDLRPCCPRCGCLDIKILSEGTILCQNKGCLAISIPNKKTDSYEIK